MTVGEDYGLLQLLFNVDRGPHWRFSMLEDIQTCRDSGFFNTDIRLNVCNEARNMQAHRQ